MTVTKSEWPWHPACDPQQPGGSQEQEAPLTLDSEPLVSAAGLPRMLGLCRALGALGGNVRSAAPSLRPSDGLKVGGVLFLVAPPSHSLCSSLVLTFLHERGGPRPLTITCGSTPAPPPK